MPPENRLRENYWQVWVDTGGTFTDCLALPPGSTLNDRASLRRAKVLSSGALRGRIAARLGPAALKIQEQWNACDDLIVGFEFRLFEDASEVVAVKRYRAAESVIELERPLPANVPAGTMFEVRGGMPAPILAARLVTQTPAQVGLPPIQMRLATTRGTNALLERRSAPVALFITRGFGDLLAIGDQQRPDLFARSIEKPQPLYDAAVEVTERITASGEIHVPLDLNSVREDARRLVKAGIRTAAVALMHSHIHPDHERMVADVLRQAGFEHVSLSSDLSPLIRLLPRAQTAVVNAYLAPVVETYLRDVQFHLDSGGKRSRLHVLTSAGGLSAAAKYRARDSLLSGPAGGVAGAAVAGRESGFSRIIGFDMGGTSTDVARYDGDFEYRFEQTIAGVRLMAPALAIETVAAGGGSICDYAEDRLTVGPHSAGAQPGPACYGGGGPLTLTDVNLLLGRLNPAQFEIPIDAALSQSALRNVLARISRTQAGAATTESILQGFLDIANQRMAAAIERISIRQGYDPRDDALVAFGGAGGQHACAIASRLGMRTIILPAEASLLSALGLGCSVIERIAERQVLRTLAQCYELREWIDALIAGATMELADEGVDHHSIEVRRVIVSMRLIGQDSSLAIDLPVQSTRHPTANIRTQLEKLFSQRYVAVYGHAALHKDQGSIEVESIRVIVASADQSTSQVQPAAQADLPDAQANGSTRAFFGDSWMSVQVFDRDKLPIGACIAGPALVFERRSTAVIEPGWTGTLDSAGALVLRASRDTEPVRKAEPEIARVELFSNRLAAIADEMGQMLQRTALSTNVKERLDFSCAVLDAGGELVVNAPHIPVHLGALGVCVRAVRDVIQMNEGDVIVTNHPAFGGSHLPDVTVITPVHGQGMLIGYVASRAHHAEIGGTRPGSMPPAARCLAEEGVVISPTHLIKGGTPRFDDIERLLRGGLHPSRNVGDNLADLRAAVAANHRGANSLRALAIEHGIAEMREHMRALTQRAERLTRAALAQRAGDVCEATELLDDGSILKVTLRVHGDSAVIDFTGSAPTHSGNLNATPAIVRSTVMYVLRLLIGERLPLNEGIMRAVDVHIPHGMLNPKFVDDPALCPAVVGGNTETSQRIVDTLLKALNLCACSQGTMNNLLFGNDRFGYYETVCGGSGAGQDFHGADAVHTHMTNTRITDPEIVEHRYPVRVEQFAIRRGSGGRGQFRGGDGVVREFTFLAPVSLSVLSQHRVQAPYGMSGGASGARGTQRVIRADGAVIHLESIDGCEVMPGDRIVLETPGGGGWGTPR